MQLNLAKFIIALFQTEECYRKFCVLYYAINVFFFTGLPTPFATPPPVHRTRCWSPPLMWTHEDLVRASSCSQGGFGEGTRDPYSRVHVSHVLPQASYFGPDMRSSRRTKQGPWLQSWSWGQDNDPNPRPKPNRTDPSFCPLQMSPPCAVPFPHLPTSHVIRASWTSSGAYN